MFPIQTVWNSFTSRFSSPHSWDGTTLTLTVPDPGLAGIVHSRLGTQISRFLRALSENPDAEISVSSPKTKPSGGV